MKMRVNMSAKDVFNANTSSVKVAFNLPIKLAGFAVTEGKDKETGETKEIGYVKDTEGNIYGFISSVAIESLENLHDFVTETYGTEQNPDYYPEGDITIKFIKGTSKGGREFTNIVIV